MIPAMALWPCIAGVVFLVAGAVVARKQIATATGIDKLIVLGRTFYGASLAAFGAEHLSGAQFIQGGVPAWMPWHLFWAYFVGFALIASALSLIFGRLARWSVRWSVRWSALLTCAMILMFVFMIHLPNAAAAPGGRIIWTVILRDLCFATSMGALAGSLWGKSRMISLITLGRICIGVALIFFAAQHLLHPTFAPGVPLEKMTPSWVPAPALWGCLMAALLLAGGVAILVNRRARQAAAWLGLVMIVLTVALYLPILLMDQPASMVEGTNYVFDTLMYAGTLLVLAEVLPQQSFRPKAL